MMQDLFKSMQYKYDTNIIISIGMNDVQKVSKWFNKMKDGGKITCDLREMPWSKIYGSLKDKKEYFTENIINRNGVRAILLAHPNPVYIGEDFARSGDLTSIFFDEEMPEGRLLTFLVIELRNVPFSQQWQVIKYVMDTLPDLGGAAFDSRGNGQMIAELAAQEWPGYVYQVMISTKWYAENFPGLKGSMEDGETTIPDDPFIRDDFRVVGLKAGVPCVLERSGGPRERRHGDGAIGKLMAFYAHKEDDAKGCQPMTYEAVETENRYREKKDLWDNKRISLWQAEGTAGGGIN
jgi:phage FluMu gp28-like protein